MSTPIWSIADYAVRISPKGTELMVALRAYCDESGKQEDPMVSVVSMGAVAATIDQWRSFETAWDMMLRDHGVPYLHMKEIGKRKGPYAKWQSDDGAVKAFLTDAVTAIVEAKLECCGLAFFKSDLKRILKEKELPADHYAFSLYAAASMVSSWALNYHGEDPRFQMIMDQGIDKFHKRAATAEELFESDRFMSWRGWPSVMASNRSSKEIPGLQAADLLAWELQNSLKIKRKWFEEVKASLPEAGLDEFTDSLLRYQMEAKGIAQIDPANPFVALDRLPLARLRNAGARSFLLDYERLKNHIFMSRNHNPPKADVVESIRKAGRHFPCA